MVIQHLKKNHVPQEKGRTAAVKVCMHIGDTDRTAERQFFV